MSVPAIAPLEVRTRAEVASGPRRGEWLADPGFGVYVHVPFCLHRCHYCDFNAYEGQTELYRPYADALVRHIGSWAGTQRTVTSVFFGGGTPTVLDARDLGRVLDAIRRRFGLAPGAEVTIEANPETVDETKFEALLDAGFNRFSIGVQSLARSVLQGLGRVHGPDVARRAARAARSAGVEDLNLDLIYGSPWERREDWDVTLAEVAELAPDHLSAYALTVEEGTPLATFVATGRVPDVDADVQADRHGVASETLGSAGYVRYEVSNWSRPGRASRHNVLYWSAGDYAGFGAGAHSHIAGRRSWRLRLPREYVAAVTAGTQTEEGSEVLDPATRAGEALMLGLRLASGIDARVFAARFGDGFLRERAGVISVLVADGLLEADGDRLRVAERATLLLNEVITRLF